MAVMFKDERETRAMTDPFENLFHMLTVASDEPPDGREATLKALPRPGTMPSPWARQRGPSGGRVHYELVAAAALLFSAAAYRVVQQGPSRGRSGGRVHYQRVTHRRVRR
jgi:hypothetical protein